MADDAPKRNVAIVGGGLGGMAAALVLSAHPGLRVTLFEASQRLGGKAGASLEDGHFEDHGYHIFPPWYANAYAVLDHLGIRGNLKDMPRFHQLYLGEYPRFRPLVNFTSVHYALQNLRSGSIPFWDLILYYYSVIDLVSQPYSERAFLDQISVNGFVRSRFYRTESVSRQYQDLLLKFVSVPSYKVSAMTVQKMLNFWVANADPMSRILAGDMHSTFIGPWEERLLQQGCTIVKGSRLTNLRMTEGRITALELNGADSASNTAEDIDAVILAVPARNAAPLLSDDIHQADPDLAKLNYLNSEAMASLSVYLNHTITHLPSEHVNLLGSRFALTFIDISQHWPGFAHTVLNVIASDVQELEEVTAEYATAQILAELKRFLPFLQDSMITRLHFQPHFAEPLVMNEVGVWPYRPKTRTAIPNLYMAGTHCQHPVDMTSMEGAILSGLAAANAYLEAEGLDGKWEIRQARTIRRWLFVLARWLLLPGAAAAKGWLWFRGRTGND